MQGLTKPFVKPNWVHLWELSKLVEAKQVQLQCVSSNPLGVEKNLQVSSNSENASGAKHQKQIIDVKKISSGVEHQ